MDSGFDLDQAFFGFRKRKTPTHQKTCQRLYMAARKESPWPKWRLWPRVGQTFSHREILTLSLSTDSSPRTGTTIETVIETRLPLKTKSEFVIRGRNILPSIHFRDNSQKLLKYGASFDQ